MRRQLTLNELNIIKLIYHSPKKILYADIERVMTFETGKDKYWSTFSTICSLVESNIITTTAHPATYMLTEYGRSRIEQIT